MRVCSKCIECGEFLQCKDEDRCKHNPEYTRFDVSWREFSSSDSILDEVEYGDIVLALHQEKEIDKCSALRVVKEIIDQRLQDFWYLVNLNIDQLIEEAKKNR